MIRFIGRAAKAPGLSPGTLVHVGEKKIEKARITLIDYDETTITEKQIENVEECFPFKDTPTVTWINIDGLHDVDIIEKIGGHFEVHPLILEDILNAGQRPKLEDMETYILIVLKMLYFDKDTNRIVTEQVSLILGSTYVISFQEAEGDIFDPIRERLRRKRGRIRRLGADYLAYALIDAVVDNYFVFLEKYGDRIESLEEELTTDPRQETLNAIHALRQEMVMLRRSVWPLREVIGGLEREESPLIRDNISVFLRDLYDHTIQVIDSVETLSEVLSGMQDLYLSSVSNKMNEVMKVLTIFASIFIPLTFMAGIYGMNFKFMPELEIKWAYPTLWGAMIAVAAGLLTYFRRKKWL